MKNSPKTARRITISPGLIPESLIRRLDLADNDRMMQVLRPMGGDEYVIDPLIRVVTNYEDFGHAYADFATSDTFRLLTLREAIFVYLRKRKPTLRKVCSFVVCEGFALDLSSDGGSDGGQTVSEGIIWNICDCEQFDLGEIGFLVTKKTQVNTGAFTEDYLHRTLGESNLAKLKAML